MESSYIYGSLRTPFGRYGGVHSSTRPDDLLAGLLRDLCAREGISPGSIDEVIAGNANGAGEENRNVARMALLLADFPTSVPGVTVNRLCGSSLEAVIQADRAVRSGDHRLVLAAGVESMTRAPLVLPKATRAYSAKSMTAESTTLGWRLVNPRMPHEWTISLGEANEALAVKWEITRTEQDEFAVRSHRLAVEAWGAEKYDSLVPRSSEIDESVRADSSSSSLAQLRPAFSEQGTITAGNASPLSDGASVVMIGSRARGEELGLTPDIRIAGHAVIGNDPDLFGIAPILAGTLAVEKAGIAMKDLGAIELNEAFAVQSLICIKEWNVDIDVVNKWGGAIAIGHPLGATGVRLISTLAERMRVENIRWGMASLCVGVGQGMAVILENVSAGK